MDFHLVLVLLITVTRRRAVGNAGASGVSEAKMKRLLEEDKERLDFEEDHMVRLVSDLFVKRSCVFNADHRQGIVFYCGCC